jgi:hypothetical protein
MKYAEIAVSVKHLPVPEEHTVLSVLKFKFALIIYEEVCRNQQYIPRNIK